MSKIKIGTEVGLADKNGKEILVGSRLRVEVEDGVFDTGVVWYLAPAMAIKSDTKEGSYDMHEWGRGHQVNEFEIIEPQVTSRI